MLTTLRLSSYLTAAMATACLCFAEWPYLSAIAFLVGPAAVLLVLAYRLEGRWSLSAGAANGLGLVIAIGWVGWLIYSFSEADDSRADWPWVVKLLPLIGPMLMVLLLVKLYRPKRVGDYWYIQGIGLIEVAIGGVLAGEPLFGVLLVVYLASALWFLMIFHLYREKVNSGRWAMSSQGETARGRVNELNKQAAFADSPVPRVSVSPSLPWPFLGTVHAGRWALAILMAGFLLFLVIPQHGDADQIADIISGRASGRTGFSTSAMDLNRIGTIEIDDKVAFEVFVENADGTPKLDLSPAQRWRGVVMEHYHPSGRWILDHHPLLTFQPIPQRELPDLGPNQYFLTFHVDTRQSGGLVLADPVVLSGNPRSPYVPLTHEDQPKEAMSLFQEVQGTGTLFPALLPGPARVTYRQVSVPAAGDGLGPALTLLPDPSRRKPSDAVPVSEILSQELFFQPVKGIRQFTRELLEHLVAEGKLTREDLQRPAKARGNSDEKPAIVPRTLPDMKRMIVESSARAALPPEKRAKVARALSDYLTFSGEYSYSLNLRREDYDLDPTEDFLRNVKEGHCERFATGLALMLRSAGVPCRVVKGFRGAETRDGTRLGDGWYVVRHSHAHAWVEALVGGSNKKLHWLTLDPSPMAADEESRTFIVSLWDRISWLTLRDWWRTFVLEYNMNQQRDTAQTFWNRLGPIRRFGAQQGPFYLASGVVLFGGVLWFRRARARRRRSASCLPAELTFYCRLQQVLARYARITPQPGQTPQEFGQAAQKLLQSMPHHAPVAEIPSQVVQLFYRARYGRQLLDPTERQGVDLAIDRLTTVLKTSREKREGKAPAEPRSVHGSAGASPSHIREKREEPVTTFQSGKQEH